MWFTRQCGRQLVKFVFTKEELGVSTCKCNFYCQMPGSKKTGILWQLILDSNSQCAFTCEIEAPSNISNHSLRLVMEDIALIHLMFISSFPLVFCIFYFSLLHCSHLLFNFLKKEDDILNQTVQHTFWIASPDLEDEPSTLDLSNS